MATRAVTKAATKVRGPVLDSQANPKTAVVVASDLRRKILTGQLKVGTSVREADLIEQFDISRPTLREALRILEMEQLLSVRRGSHRGSVVRLPDPSVTVRSLTMLLHLRGATTSDIYDARMIFEPPAVRLVAENATPAQIARLREVLDEGLAAMHADPLSYPIVGWRFHTELVAISGNATLAVMAETFEHISAHHAVQVVSGWAENCSELVRRAERAHRRLISLIEQGDGEQAENYWRRHMQIVRGLLFGDGNNESIVEILD
jgi:DNA-binding FadR family transcriptional regulator